MYVHPPCTTNYVQGNPTNCDLPFVPFFDHIQEGENVAKLEKADILELTVRHLHTLRHQNQLSTKPEASYADRFRAGFRHCAVEVTGFLNGLDQPTKSHLSSHLSHCIRQLEGYPANSSPAPTAAAAAPAQEVQPARGAYNYNGQGGPVPAAVSIARQQPVFPQNAEDHHSRMALGRSPSPSHDGPVSPGSATSDENVWRPW